MNTKLFRLIRLSGFLSAALEILWVQYRKQKIFLLAHVRCRLPICFQFFSFKMFFFPCSIENVLFLTCLLFFHDPWHCSAILPICIYYVLKIYAWLCGKPIKLNEKKREHKRVRISLPMCNTKIRIQTGQTDVYNFSAKQNTTTELYVFDDSEDCCDMNIATMA